METHPRTKTLATELLIRLEGCETTAYLDPVGVPTICTGLTRYPNEEPVRLDDVCHEDICGRYTEQLITDKFIPVLSRIPGWSDFGAIRQSVLISFAWNMGVNFYESTGFEEISNLLRKGFHQPELYDDVPDVLNLYVFDRAKRLAGLEKRREIEGEEWKKESIGYLKLKNVQDTYLKKAPIESTYLSDTGKRTIDVEEELVITKFKSIHHTGHAWVHIKEEQEPWIIYLPHWKHLPSRTKKTLDWNDMSSFVAEYITVGELLQYNHSHAPLEGSRIEKNLIRLAEEFRAIREAWGAAIGIAGGYTPLQGDISLHPVEQQAHHEGMALDIYPVNDDTECLYRWLYSRWTGNLHNQSNNGFVHIDISNNGRFIGMR